MSQTNIASIRRSAHELETNLDQILKPVRKFADSYGLKPFTIIPFEVGSGKSAEPLSTVEKSTVPANTIIFAVRKVFTKQLIDDFITDIARTRRVAKSSLNTHRAHVEESISPTKNRGRQWANKQAQLGIDILFASAQAAGILAHEAADANYDVLEKILDLPAKGFQIISVVSLQSAETKSQRLN